MRSTTWISVLVALFMFQSLWNVAAAFCVNEEQKTQVVTQQNFHFGHHQTTLCVSDDKAHQQSSADSHTQTANDQFELGEDHQDHQDHLPSMAHLIIPKEKNYQLPLALELRVRPQFFWHNAYQAPDLLGQHPPPELSPLMVG